VQSESFFDPRLLHRGIADGVLGNYDALRAAGASGRLAVPGWGAYTMRTEFAFLSGIGANRLGVHRFNPYRRFARQPISTLAWYLRTIGYRTVEEYEEWRAKDPIELTRRKLRALNLLSEADEKRMVEEMQAEIDAAFEYAKAAPLPDPSQASQFVYA